MLNNHKWEYTFRNIYYTSKGWGGGGKAMYLLKKYSIWRINQTSWEETFPKYGVNINGS